MGNTLQTLFCFKIWGALCKMNEIKERCGIYNVFWDTENCEKCGHETRWLHYELNTCSDCTIEHFKKKEI